MYVKGEWNAICPVCGFKYKSSEMREMWTGDWVCKYDWEPRHPLDFVRGKKDDQSVPWSRPDVDNSADVVTGIDISFSGNTISSRYATDYGSDLSIFSRTIEIFGSNKNDGELTVSASTTTSITVLESLTTETEGAVITISGGGASIVDPSNDTQPDDL